MTAIKLRIRDLVEGSFDGNCVHTSFGDVSEARVLGTLIDIFATEDKNYLSLTIDDGSDTIRVKAWRQDTEKLKKFSKGDLIEVVGRVREYNDEIYLTPEVVSRVSPNRWVLRELELMKQYVEAGRSPQRQPPGEAELHEHAPETGGRDVERAEPEEGEEIAGEPEVQVREEVEEFQILGEDEVVETVLELLKDGMTREELTNQSGLDEIDVELALRELLDEKKIKKEGDIYKKV